MPSFPTSKWPLSSEAGIKHLTSDVKIQNSKETSSFDA